MYVKQLCSTYIIISLTLFSFLITCAPRKQDAKTKETLKKINYSKQRHPKQRYTKQRHVSQNRTQSNNPRNMRQRQNNQKNTNPQQTKPVKPNRPKPRNTKPNQSKPRQKPKPFKPVKPPKPIPQQPQDYEQVQKEDHERVCNILGFASNIFGNFVQLIRDPNNERNIGSQVGNMAQNIFHIVAQATKRFNIHKSDPSNLRLLEYLHSKDFAEDLTTLVLEQLEDLEKKEIQ